MTIELTVCAVEPSRDGRWRVELTAPGFPIANLVAYCHAEPAIGDKVLIEAVWVKS